MKIWCSFPAKTLMRRNLVAWLCNFQVVFNSSIYRICNLRPLSHMCPFTPSTVAFNNYYLRKTKYANELGSVLKCKGNLKTADFKKCFFWRFLEILIVPLKKIRLVLYMSGLPKKKKKTGHIDMSAMLQDVCKDFGPLWLWVCLNAAVTWVCTQPVVLFTCMNFYSGLA